ncbi:S-adenosyl-L-methionine-dependent methyltransferase [Plectosphaerella plurivora]|uniref:S-adenosyl-L-methionine-dependent methyltransferase n=1 Tax=Plectosphaerella plurivora TaxID=936078 RepID=A0A9P8VEI7_9PEZI|nr:S-adenosyl-L-methionine-dependent methyltransferase [Plectosphaerella plurivora]
MADQDPVPTSATSPKNASSPKSKSSPKSRASPEGASPPGPDVETAVLPADYWAQAQFDDDDDDDSALGANSIHTDSTSLASSIFQYRVIQGRTFHGERGKAQYWGTNDEAQNEALDIVHHVLTLLLDGKLYLAPLKDDIKSAIDIGTGTGIWAIDFADQFPNAQVTGTDLSPIQPSWVPPNVYFQIDDCTQDWTFKPDSTDFVHLRWLVGSVIDWDALMIEAFRTLAPGGYLESHEGSIYITSDDGSVHDKTALSQWGPLFLEGGRRLGRPFLLLEQGIIRSAMEAAGFVDIEVHDFKCPVGGWPRDEKLAEVGTYMRMALDQDAEGAVLFTAHLQGWSKEEVLVYAARLRREMAQSRYHAYFRTQVVFGRKPEIQAPAA